MRAFAAVLLVVLALAGRGAEAASPPSIDDDESCANPDAGDRAGCQKKGTNDPKRSDGGGGGGGTGASAQLLSILAMEIKESEKLIALQTRRVAALRDLRQRVDAGERIGDKTMRMLAQADQVQQIYHIWGRYVVDSRANPEPKPVLF